MFCFRGFIHDHVCQSSVGKILVDVYIHDFDKMMEVFWSRWIEWVFIVVDVVFVNVCVFYGWPVIVESLDFNRKSHSSDV